MIFFELPNVYIIALVVQAILYGLYLVTFVDCVRWLVFDDDGWRFRPWAQLNWPMLAATVLVFLLETTEIGASVALVSQVKFYQESPLVKNIVTLNVMLEIATMLVADAVMILRCWVIYAKSWRIICPPLFLLVSMAGCTISLPIILSPTEEDLLEENLTLPVFATILACNIANNMYVTAAIVYQIQHGSNRKSKRLYRIIAESGMLCSLTSMILLVTVVIKKTRLFMGVICDAIYFPVTGMAFNIILIRAAWHRAQEARCTRTEGTINPSCSSFR